MRGLLCLLIQHIVVGVADKRSVVRMEEHLVRNLEDVKEIQVSSVFIFIPLKKILSEHALLFIPIIRYRKILVLKNTKACHQPMP